MADLLLPIHSRRLALVVLSTELLAVMSGDADGNRPFDWPPWWPDDVDRAHVRMWRDRAAAAERNIAWGPRALVDADLHMVGHAGFHLPPRPLAEALDDPTFVGQQEPGNESASEIGYTIFPDQRGRGYATEAVDALVEWAARTGEVRVVLATIVRGHDASVRVLDRVGGFVAIGTCRDDDGETEIVYRRDLNTDTAAP